MKPSRNGFLRLGGLAAAGAGVLAAAAGETAGRSRRPRATPPKPGWP